MRTAKTTPQSRHKSHKVVTDPVQSAKCAGLRYVNDGSPGIRRKAIGTKFRYIDSAGRPIRDTEIVRRIKSLVIPPAWTDVWICPHPTGHIQATARDARGRKQYRYHPRWREVRDATKFERTIAFAAVLPKIRKRVAEDMAGSGLTRTKVLATVVKLLEVSLIRIGNQEYAKDNHSFGLTTMRDRHVDVDGATVQFKFRGKSGKLHEISIHDRRIATIVGKCQEISGHELFHYVDREGAVHTIESGDVNDYLKEISGDDFTAKDFRTWAGTVLASQALREFERFDSSVEAKRNVVSAIKKVAERLGNTPTVCRKCYIHPVVLSTYLDGLVIDTLRQRAEAEIKEGLSALTPEEAAVLMLLEQRLAHDSLHSTDAATSAAKRKSRSKIHSNAKAA